MFPSMQGVIPEPAPKMNRPFPAIITLNRVAGPVKTHITFPVGTKENTETASKKLTEMDCSRG